MELKEKLAALEDMMELDENELTPDTCLSSIDEWDSLAALSYVVFMMDEFQKKVSGAEIRAFQTVQDILDTMQT